MSAPRIDLEGAFAEWVLVYGQPPVANDWVSNSPWPSHSTVYRRFGSWSKFVEAQGYPSRPVGAAPKHGQSGYHPTAEYNTWACMRKRCNNVNLAHYKDYGGRGITVCPEWDLFETFFEDMGSRPEGHSLDRIDNDKGYSPDNCRWATASEQALNRRPRSAKQVV